MKATHLEARYFTNLTGIKRRTFYDRVASKEVEYIEPFNGDRKYSIKDWNKKNPDYKLDISKIDEA